MNIELIAIPLVLCIVFVTFGYDFLRERKRRLRENTLSEIEAILENFSREIGDYYASIHCSEIEALMKKSAISFDEISIKSKEDLRRTAFKAFHRYVDWYGKRHAELEYQRKKARAESSAHPVCDTGMQASDQVSLQHLLSLPKKCREFEKFVESS